ncbi:hypothetical protein [Bradyrhizobium diazoefficiens]|uniref:Uncharacterized protein n=1 Tax=Bradyrhizobium diazoefficiens TaxID=1355477 RepID=A0A810BI83_9BRAD|nr:hypothetical protein XF8B_58150 [Bradyrhizobium diazoefficiens]
MTRDKKLPDSSDVDAVADRNAEPKPTTAQVHAYSRSISLEPYPRLRDRYWIVIDDLPGFPILASKLLSWKKLRKAVKRQIGVNFPEEAPPNWHDLVSAAPVTKGGAS